MDWLKKRSEFLKVSKAGNRWVTPAFIVQVYSRSSEEPNRCGITASRKVGGAVKRNRAKRRLRSLARMTIPQQTHRGTDYVLIAREEVLKRDFSVMVQELDHALKKLRGAS